MHIWDKVQEALGTERRNLQTMFSKMQLTQNQIAEEMEEEYKLRGKRMLEAQQQHFTAKLRSYQTQLEVERMLYDVLVDMHGPVLRLSRDQNNQFPRPISEGYN